MSLASRGSIFLDTSVILWRSLPQGLYRERIQRLFDRARIARITIRTTRSVLDECNAKIAEFETFTDGVLHRLRANLLQALSDSRNPVSLDPLLGADLVEEFFIQDHQALFPTRSPGVGLRQNLLRALELWIVDILDQAAAQGRTLPLDEFIADLGIEAIKIRANLRNQLDVLQAGEISVETVQPSTEEQVAIAKVLAPSRAGARNLTVDDVLNLASVATYQRQTDSWCVFATLDFSDLVRNRRALSTACGVACVDPLHAVRALERILERYGMPPSKVDSFDPWYGTR